jgi:hypothetical protein
MFLTKTGIKPALPAPGSRLPAPGSRLPAPGSRLPAPGSRLPAPGSYYTHNRTLCLLNKTTSYSVRNSQFLLFSQNPPFTSLISAKSLDFALKALNFSSGSLDNIPRFSYSKAKPVNNTPTTMLSAYQVLNPECNHPMRTTYPACGGVVDCPAGYKHRKGVFL